MDTEVKITSPALKTAEGQHHEISKVLSVELFYGYYLIIGLISKFTVFLAFPNYLDKRIIKGPITLVIL